MGQLASTTSPLTAVGLRLDGRELSAAEWAELGKKLGRLANSATWSIADWALYGSRTFKWGTFYRQAAEVSGLSERSLRTLAWVANRVPFERRRRELSLGHHREVAQLDERDQERWLDFAAEEGWSSKRLRAAVQTERRRDDRRAAVDSTVVGSAGIRAEEESMDPDEPRVVRIEHTPEQAHGAVVRALRLVAASPSSRAIQLEESNLFAGETLGELPGLDAAALQALAERVSRAILGLATIALVSIETVVELTGLDRLEVLKRLEDASAAMFHAADADADSTD